VVLMAAPMRRADPETQPADHARPTPAQVTALLLLAGLAAWTVNLAIFWLSGPPLGHDEAQYTIAARDLLNGEEQRWFYLSTGTSLLAIPGLLAGGSEVALRTPTFVLGIGFGLVVVTLAWRYFGAATAAWVAAILGGMRGFTKVGPQLLSDLPAATCLLAGTLVIVSEVTREDGPRWRAVLAAPLLAAALYLRYASCVPIAILGAAALGFGLRSIARRPAPIVATAALFLALLVPHAVAATRATGWPLGVLLASKDVPQHTWIAEGLVDYVAVNPVRTYGLLAPLVLIAGLLAGLRLRDRRAKVLWTVAVLDIVAIGLVTHAQTRYISYGLALLVVLGTDVLRRWIAARSPRARAAIGATAAIAMAVTWVLIARVQGRAEDSRAASLRTRLDAAALIRADAAGAPCLVVGDPFTQLEWYSGCRGATWPWDDLGRARIYLYYRPEDPPRETRGRPQVLFARRDAIVTRYDP